MITSVRANKESFRPVNFTSGLNVVVADRTKESTKKDTRNGLGKSTLIEILHYALGSEIEALASLGGWEFTVGLRLGNRSVSVTRGIDDPKHLTLGGQIEGWGVGKAVEGGRRVSQADWCELLGQGMFGLSAKAKREKWVPTFRSLISYFARRGKDAYSDPFTHYRKQSEWDKQVANAYLLGLSWENARERELLRQKDKALDALRSAAKAGLIDGLSGKLGELDAERVILAERAGQQEAALRSFRVHPQYRQIEERATALTQQIHEASNANVSDRNLLGYYRQSLDGVVLPEDQDVVALYAEAGAVLPELVRRRLEEVREFHEKLVGNRRDFLAEEVARLADACRARDEEIKSLTEERAGLLQILELHGALEEYTRLQTVHLATVEELRALDARIANIRKVEAGKSELKVEQEQLFQRSRRDYDDRREIWQRAIKSFNSHSQALHNESGKLEIQVASTGFKFHVEIPRARSGGISNMKVFCYDLTLAELWSEKRTSPGFLVHDSLIFDGVDERQKALALQRAEAVSRERGFQYICTINSDAIPHSEFDSGFHFDDFVRLRLTDASGAGCLLGMRFG